MTAATRVLAVLFSLGLLLAVGALSRLPIEGEHAGSAALRLTWRVRGEEVVECRAPTEEEMAELPVHMRNPDACIGSIPPFHLTVEVDGVTRTDAMIEAAGARADRPLYVYRQLLLEPGTHEVRVRFVPEDGSAGEGDQGLGSLTFSGPVTLEAGQVMLLTRSRDDAGGLELREPAR